MNPRCSRCLRTSLRSRLDLVLKCERIRETNTMRVGCREISKSYIMNNLYAKNIIIQLKLQLKLTRRDNYPLHCGKKRSKRELKETRLNKFLYFTQLTSVLVEFQDHTRRGALAYTQFIIAWNSSCARTSYSRRQTWLVECCVDSWLVDSVFLVHYLHHRSLPCISLLII